MSWSRWAVAVVGLSLAVAVPARAEATWELTLTGERSGYVDVTIARTANLSLHDELTVSRGGDYAGYVVQRISDGEVLGGAVDAAGMGRWRIPRPTSAPPQGLLEGSQNELTLAPGAYRFYLVADDVSSVAIPLHGRGDDLVVAATGPVTASANVLDLGNALVSTRYVPLPSNSTTLGFLAAQQSSLAGAVTRAGACFRATATEECAQTDFNLVMGSVESSSGTWESAWPGSLPAGRTYGVLQIQSASVLPHALGFYLTLDTGISPTARAAAMRASRKASTKR